jgi:hypothetical protein
MGYETIVSMETDFSVAASAQPRVLDAPTAMDGEASDVQPPDLPLAADDLAAATQRWAQPLTIPEIAPFAPDVGLAEPAAQGLAVATQGLPRRRQEVCQPAKAAAASGTYPRRSFASVRTRENHRRVEMFL